MKIGILDDNQDIRDILCLAVELEGHQPRSYNDAAELIRDIASFDLIIVDLCIPGQLPGEQVIERARIFRNDIQAIVISALSSSEIAERTRAITGIRRLQKPFRLADLIGLIDRYGTNPQQHPHDCAQRQHSQASRITDG